MSRRATLGRAVVLIALCVMFAGRARGEPAGPGALVALLPLDADRSLEIYGQPIASEISRMLKARAIQVVVVGPKMAVPEGARLIVDGTITAAKSGAITVAIRVRNPLDGRVLGDPLTATATGLAKLDAATADVATRLLPVVQAQLAALPSAPSVDRTAPPFGSAAGRGSPAVDRTAPPSAGHGHVTQSAPAPTGDHTVVVAIGDETHNPETAALTTALDPVVAEWTRAHHRQLQKIDPTKLAPKLATQAVGTSDFAIGLWVVSYAREVINDVPMARATVRVRLASASQILFDRVLVTDTVLGDRGASPAELAARVSREVLAILRPHLMSRVRAWE